MTPIQREGLPFKPPVVTCRCGHKRFNHTESGCFFCDCATYLPWTEPAPRRGPEFTGAKGLERNLDDTRRRRNFW